MKKATLISLISFIFLISPTTQTYAAFNPNFIISDYEFRDYLSMTLDDIQRFLENKGSQLAKYVDPKIRVRASQLIYDNARLTKINPKVLLVKLQKEQSLITDSNPSQNQLDWATGYGVCDSCSKSDPSIQKYKGFANQIDYAASSLRLFHDNPQKYGYQVGQNYTIDNQLVTIDNSATHALYLYTPHIHGNQNFYNIWQDWFTKTFPDGTLLQDADSGGIYLIQNGTKRPFSSKLAFATRYDFNKIITTSKENIESYPLGSPIRYAQYALVRSPRGTVYLIVDDKKRGITSQEVFRTIGFNPEEVTDLDQEEINSIPEGSPITLTDSYPTGALLQDTISGGVWYIQDGIRHSIWTKDLLDINYSHLTITPTHPDDIAAFTLGDPAQFKDGELIKSTDDPGVYVISNGLKRLIPSASIFEKLGYKWENIRTVSYTSLTLHQDGQPLSINDLTITVNE